MTDPKEVARQWPDVEIRRGDTVVASDGRLYTSPIDRPQYANEKPWERPHRLFTRAEVEAILQRAEDAAVEALSSLEICPPGENVDLYRERFRELMRNVIDSTKRPNRAR